MDNNISYSSPQTVQRQIGEYVLVLTNPAFESSGGENMDLYEHFHVADESRCPNIFGVNIFLKDRKIASAAIGSAGGSSVLHETAMVMEEDRILLCCSDSVFCLSIPSLALLWRTKADDATCFQIFRYKETYIVHGELEISRLDRSGNILWQQGGRDIFVTPDGQECCLLADKHILATDWEYNRYVLDYENGRIMEDGE
ncbi:MAG: hypothetical protein LBU46_08000 [Candidatus Accumulibacter sp.]|nr:hypothetical protein [Accumulibacter sp.]